EEKVVVPDWNGTGYRLPTEAEWEYAGRAGSNTRYGFGNRESDLSDHAWFHGNSQDQTRPVGQKLPNSWGLYDMHGNVWEWCWDRYGQYDQQSLRDPHGPQEPSSDSPYRVVRGGSFDCPPEDLRSAFRSVGHPEFRISCGGFRCVRVPPALAS